MASCQINFYKWVNKGSTTSIPKEGTWGSIPLVSQIKSITISGFIIGNVYAPSSASITYCGYSKTVYPNSDGNFAEYTISSSNFNLFSENKTPTVYYSTGSENYCEVYITVTIEYIGLYIKDTTWVPIESVWQFSNGSWIRVDDLDWEKVFDNRLWVKPG